MSSIQKLETAGRVLYGQTWQTQLSSNLVNSKGNPLDHRRLQHWVAGTVPVPEWVWPQIRVLAEQRRKEIEDFLKLA